jgi:hypothetical protein
VATFDNALPEGASIADYEVADVLGEPGSFGITYRATDRHLRRDVAIKEYFPADYAARRAGGLVEPKDAAKRATFEWGLERFSEEARTLAQFDHRNIVKVMRLISGVNGTAYIVMELVKGQTLEAIVESEGPMDQARFAPIFDRLLDGVAAIHRIGILHRDIKPSNIIITEAGEPVLIDFGAARDLALQKKSGFTAIVTDTYSPPEQYSREQAQGPWTDVYALAATAYFVLTGEGPAPSTARAVGDAIQPASVAAAARADQKLLKGLDWGLTLAAKERPQSIEAWRATLDLAPGPLVPAPKPGLDRRALLLMGGGAVVLGGLGAVMAVTSLGKGGPGKVLEEKQSPLKVAWTRDLGAIDGDPWAGAAIARDGVMIAARRLGADQSPRMLAVRLADDGRTLAEWQAVEAGSAAQAILAAPDGGAFVGGEVAGQARIVRLGPDWAPRWSRDYGAGEIRSLRASGEGVIACVGAGFEAGRAKLVFVGADGSPTNEVSLLDKQNDSVERVAATADGGLIVLGSRATQIEGRNATQLWVAGLDTAYRELWRTQDFGLGSARGWALGVAGDDIFVVGTSSKGGAQDSSHLFTMRLAAKENGAKLWSRVEEDVANGTGRALALTGKAERPTAYLAGTAGAPQAHARFGQLGNDGALVWTLQAPVKAGAQVEGAVALAFRGPGDGFAAGFTFDGAGARLTASRLTS